jgi:hypothetical protein
MGVSFYARWAALGLHTVFMTLVGILVLDPYDLWVGLAGVAVASFIVGRVVAGPREPRKNYPSTVRSRR